MSRITEVTDTLVIDEQVRGWCTLRYQNHRHGCPMYGKRDTCPPKAPLVQEYFDLRKRCWFVVERFHLGAYARKMKALHPEWSDRQTRNCRFWQKGVVRKLCERAERFCSPYPGLEYTTVPEAMGVQVFRTARKNKIPIERNPQEWVYKIALCGYRRRRTL